MSKTARKLEELLSQDEIKISRRDAHAKRKPRLCGFTVHVGYNCPYSCLYCYIDSMGFKFGQPVPYPLSGYAIAYALLHNKYFRPGKKGSLIAIGSISEPFHPNLIQKTREFLEASARFLGNPTQFSTKCYISENLAEWMASLKLPINPLITITTVEKLNLLEPNAPSLKTRLRTIENLANAGLKPMIFVRPIIIGITDIEAKKIGEIASSHGAVGAVVGGLRVTRQVLRRLGSVMDIGPIFKRIPRYPKSNEQLALKCSDVKRKVIDALERAGLKVFSYACIANAFNANVLPACYNLNRCHYCELENVVKSEAN